MIGRRLVQALFPFTGRVGVRGDTAAHAEHGGAVRGELHRADGHVQLACRRSATPNRLCRNRPHVDAVPSRSAVHGPALSGCRSPTPAGTSRRGPRPSAGRRHRCRHCRHQMPHPRRGAHRQQFGHRHRSRPRDSSQVVAYQVDDHDVLRDVLDRRAQCRRVGDRRGSVPLIGLEVTASPQRRRNSSGDSDATAPQSPAT